MDFAPVISRAVNRCVRTLFQAVTRTSLAEIKGIVPSYRSLLIYYDSNATSFESLRDRVAISVIKLLMSHRKRETSHLSPAASFD